MSDLPSRRVGRRRYSLIVLNQLVKTDFKLRYQGSAVAYVWAVLKPAALFAILYVVFSLFLRVGEGVDNFPIYLLLGIVIWTYFADVTQTGLRSIVLRGEILRRIDFPRHVVVVSASLSAFINLAINMVVVLVFIYFADAHVDLSVLFAPLLILELFVFALGVSLFLSASFVRFRDLTHIWEVLLQGAFYATPILYPVTFVSEYSATAAKVLMLNPVAQIVQDLRYVMVTEDSVRIDQLFGNHWIRLVPIGVTVLIALSAAWFFQKRSRYFAEEL